MKKELKAQVVANIAAQLKETPNFYVTDIAGLNAEQTTQLRRACFEAGIKLTVVKNTLFEHVIKDMDDEIKLIIPALKGNSAIMYTGTANAPAKLIKKLRKEGLPKPELKAAYVQECAFVGADKLEELASIKSKEELLGDIISLLQSPARNVISALHGAAGSKVAGLVKAIEEKK